MDDEKLCFVVCPIGDPGSPTRKRSNGILREVIERVAGDQGYRVKRADHDKAPGIVTESIVRKIIEADLVVADLHGHNPNVMYEVAIRHATGAPIIQMIPEEEGLPFDIGGLNTIQYDGSVDGLARFRDHLDAAITAVEEGEGGENPVSRAGMFRALEASEGDTERVLVQILERLEEIELSPNRRLSSHKLRQHELPLEEWALRGDTAYIADLAGEHLTDMLLSEQRLPVKMRRSIDVSRRTPDEVLVRLSDEDLIFTAKRILADPEGVVQEILSHFDESDLL